MRLRLARSDWRLVADARLIKEQHDGLCSALCLEIALPGEYTTLPKSRRKEEAQKLMFSKNVWI